MTPCSACGDAADGRLADPKHKRQPPLVKTFGTQAAHFDHSLFGQDRVGMILPFGYATVFLAVCHVLGLCADIDMLRVAAAPIVALVVELFAGLQLNTMMEVVGETMGSHRAMVDTDFAIAVFVQRSCPFKAATILIDYGVGSQMFERVGIGNELAIFA